MPLKIAIIGAGPIGLEAAVAAEDRGHEVILIEKGRPAEAMRQWGHVRMFSPFGMNSSVAGTERLRSRGISLPDADSLLTGGEHVVAYLEPLAMTLGNKLRAATEVLAIGRAGVGKGDKIGEPTRGETPFRLLLRKQSSAGFFREQIETADIVLDCTGTWSNPNPLGEGGIPGAGEAACRDRILTGVPDVRGRQREELTGRRVLVVGGGHSAATVICELAEINGDCAESKIIWAVRRQLAEPCQRLANDPLTERDRLACEANALIKSGRVDFRAGVTVQALQRCGDGVAVRVASASRREEILVDRVIASCGFRPDLNLARELQTQTCWATEGTYKLAAALLGESAGDCLAVPGFGPETLVHPEPGYFALGMKSYGRSPNFLIRTGLEQVAGMMQLLEQHR